ncbi:MAG TPA: V-type ATP synthase subunit F [Candidatus Omnitrophota bacterium]|nr:V-type ATP synthase subunit F [Candidatus Omnitrophota bacterium]HQJ14969.1 V-type ATP synthase subunit F [Candidatus Omnitrophota bacterium]
MTFFCIADKESGLGFRLAGIETIEVSTRIEALEALRVARADRDIGIILVTEKAAVFLGDEIKTNIGKDPLPLVLEVPSRGSAARHKSAAELLKELVGIGM